MAAGRESKCAMASSYNDAELSVSEAVLLGHALVARVASEQDIRAFFIKGPVSVLRGLRQPRTSSDVDVIVEPDGLDRLLQELSMRGWQPRPADRDSKSYAPHSITVDHPGWPCCIDVHYRFPGMESVAAESFEAMWANTEDFLLARQVIRVPKAPLGVLILALHALRAPHLIASRQELHDLTVLPVSKQERMTVMKLAEITGSLAAARPFLEEILCDKLVPVWPKPSTEWRDRLKATEPGTARLLALIRAPWRDRLPMLRRTVFPTPEALLSTNPYTDVNAEAKRRHNIARWARFVRLAPRIFRDLLSQH